jgi:hypothetical protein
MERGLGARRKIYNGNGKKTIPDSKRSTLLTNTSQTGGSLRAQGFLRTKDVPAAYISRRECQLVHLWRACATGALFVGLANDDPEIARMSRL